MLAEARVRRRWRETDRLDGLVLEVPEAAARAHVAPGQIVWLKIEDRRFPIAIASSPGEAAAFELLVGPPLAGIAALEQGRVISFEGPDGQGFDLGATAGKDAILFAQGSGIAALRPVVDQLIRQSPRLRIRLYVGARSPDDHAYRALDVFWAREGVEVVRVVSRPWVQELFEADGVPVENAVAFVAGGPEMTAGVREVLTRLGMPERRILLNW